MTKEEIVKAADDLIEKFRELAYGCTIESSTALEITCATEIVIQAQQMVVDAIIYIGYDESAIDLVRFQKDILQNLKERL